MVWGCISSCGVGSLHIWKDTINAESYIQVLDEHIYAPIDMTSFIWEVVAYFSMTMPNCILCLFQQHGFIVEESES